MEPNLPESERCPTIVECVKQPLLIWCERPRYHDGYHRAQVPATEGDDMPVELTVRWS